MISEGGSEALQKEEVVIYIYEQMMGLKVKKKKRSTKLKDYRTVFMH